MWRVRGLSSGLLGFTGKNNKKRKGRKKKTRGWREEGKEKEERGKKREVWVEEVQRDRKREEGKWPLLKFSKHTSHNKHVKVKRQLARIDSFLP